MATIISKDSLRASVEAATGGLVTVLYDDAGHPSYMRVIPKVQIQDVYPNLGLTGTHPAFIVDGVEKSELYIGVYPASLAGGLAVSLPGVDAATSINFDAALTACRSKGPGWHMMTNAEWALLGALGVKTNFQPHGNTNWGQYHDATYETGVRYDRGTPGDSTTAAGRTLAGSGPASWRHDNTVAGISDLVGNVNEWVLGLRLNAGEIQIIPNNNAASPTADHGASSSQWKAMLKDGSLVAPGTALTLKYDASTSGGVGAPVLNTSITNAYPETDETSTSASAQFNTLAAASGVTAPALAKLLHLFPDSSAPSVGRLYVRNARERMAVRGGNYNYGASAGLFALTLHYLRTYSSGHVGFRPAFYL